MGKIIIKTAPTILKDVSVLASLADAPEKGKSPNNLNSETAPAMMIDYIASWVEASERASVSSAYEIVGAISLPMLAAALAVNLPTLGSIAIILAACILMVAKFKNMFRKEMQQREMIANVAYLMTVQSIMWWSRSQLERQEEPTEEDEKQNYRANIVKKTTSEATRFHTLSSKEISYGE